MTRTPHEPPLDLKLVLLDLNPGCVQKLQPLRLIVEAVRRAELIYDELEVLLVLWVEQ